MKRAIVLLLLLSLLLACAPALGEGALLRSPEGMADAVKQYFSAASFAGYTVDFGAYAEAAFPVNGAWHGYAFAVAQKEGRNVLYGFRDSGKGDLRLFLTTENALPQGAGTFTLRNVTGSSAESYAFPRDTLAIYYRKPDSEEAWNLALYFEGDSKGVWNLVLVSARDMGAKYTEARVASDGIKLYENGASLGNAYGEVQTNLRYFSWAAFPKSLQEARSKLSTPPVIPAGELTAQRIRFTGGQKFAVYSGPGENYYRSGNGKAAVSTNDWIQVFGAENGYILIQYNISATQMRFGYIPASSLPKNTTVNPLALSDTPARIISGVSLTDDPLNSGAVLRTLQSGQAVTWLAAMGNWAYIETAEGGQPVRGFVPVGAIQQESPRQSYHASYQSGLYTAQAAADIQGTAAAFTVTVSGPAAWRNRAGDCLTSYQVYANNLPVQAATALNQQDGGEGWQGVFALTATLPAGTALVGLCPIYALSGPRAAEIITFMLTDSEK